MLLAFAVAPQIVFLLELKEVVGAVVVKDIFPSLNYFLTVLVELSLYEIILLCQDREGAVNIVEFEGRLLNKGRGLLYSGEL